MEFLLDSVPDANESIFCFRVECSYIYIYTHIYVYTHNISSKPIWSIVSFKTNVFRLIFYMDDLYNVRALLKSSIIIVLLLISPFMSINMCLICLCAPMRDWWQEEKGTTEDEMAGWHHRLNGCESEWTPGVGDGQGGLACCNSWGRKESDTTDRLKWTELNWCWANIYLQILYLPRLIPWSLWSIFLCLL